MRHNLSLPKSIAPTNSVKYPAHDGRGYEEMPGLMHSQRSMRSMQSMSNQSRNVARDDMLNMMFLQNPNESPELAKVGSLFPGPNMMK